MTDETDVLQRPGHKMIRAQYYSQATNAKEEQMVHRLGFTRLNQTRELPDERGIREIIAEVPHLIRIIE